MNTLELMLISERSRKRLLEIICSAKAGHTGGDLSCLNVLTALYFDILAIDKDRMDDPDRDRFILSKGHCVEALFVTLEAKGILEKEVLDTLGKYGSPLGGHPTVNVPGIEVNSGALGHGLSIGVGMALAAKMDGKSYKTFVLMGDGEQGEGSIYEAAMAGHQYKLDNLVAIIDRNHLQISGNTEDVMGLDDIRARWSAFGWDVVKMDGEQLGLVLAGGACAELVGLDVLGGVELLHGLGAGRLEAYGEDGQVGNLHGHALQGELLDALHHVGQHSVDDALREGSVVGGHVLGQVFKVVHLSGCGACIPGAGIGRIAAVVLIKLVVNHVYLLRLSSST